MAERHIGMLQLQENKRELARAALSGEGAKGFMKLTLNDIMSKWDQSTTRPGLIRLPRNLQDIILQVTHLATQYRFTLFAVQP
jgi:hypothetical protein